MHYDMTKEIPQLFGLNGFVAGPQLSLEPSEDSHFTIKFRVELLWAAQVYYFARPVVVAILHTDKQYQGVLVDIADKIENHSVVVDLEDWDDPVQRALKSINLAPSDVDPISGYYFKLFIRTELIQSEIEVSMDSGEPNLDQLAKALLETIGKIAAIYGGQHWQWFFQTRSDDEDE